VNFDNHNIIGCDISYGNGYPPSFPVTDFRRMREYGFEFVILKASQRNYPDPSFAHNIQAVQGILPYHTYHYYTNDYNPTLQAWEYWQTIKPYFQGIAWLDLEDRNPGTCRGWKHWYDFLETFMILSKLSNTQVGIYSSYWYLREELLKASWAEREYFHRYPLWLADYGVRGSDPMKPDFASKIVPAPWNDDDCLMVQTGTPVIGEYAGVSSKEIDYNFFNGGMDLFNKIFKPVTPLANLRISIRSA
jgi:GH25 family lysozyme M1 (1,4-beta-N-acetylmuramidase)